MSLQMASSIGTLARSFLSKQVDNSDQVTALANSIGSFRFARSDGLFGMHPFWVKTGQQGSSQSSFNFEAPRTAENAFRVLRALQLSKPILLEGMLERIILQIAKQLQHFTDVFLLLLRFAWRRQNCVRSNITSFFLFWSSSTFCLTLYLLLISW